MPRSVSVLLALALAAGFARPAGAADTLKLAIGQRGIWHGATADLGQRAGIFRKYDLALEILYTARAGETMQAVIAGSADVGVSADSSSHDGNTTTKIVLTNNSDHIAFFLRAEITRGEDGEEVLPITYEDNYITLFPHESRTIQASYQDAAGSGHTPALRLEGYNVGKRTAAIHAGAAQ